MTAKDITHLISNDPHGRQIDDYLMRRLDRLESAVDDMRNEFATIAGKLDKISSAQDASQPSIAVMKTVLDAGGLLKWAVSTVVVACLGFAAVASAYEALQKWLGK